MRNAQIREKSLFSKKIMGKIRAKYKKNISCKLQILPGSK